MAYGPFDAYRLRVLPMVEASLRTAISRGDLSELYSYVVEGGKRIRPALTLLVSEAFGGRWETAMDLACSVELTHCASLALDDVLDWHEERRGKAALHKAEGLSRAVTTGFTLPSIAIDLAARHGTRFARLLSGTWVSLCLGAYREEEANGMDWKGYRKLVELKTARLFATACTFGAWAADRRETFFEDYGLHLGRAFQMADDVIDGFEGGKITHHSLRREARLEAGRAADLAKGWNSQNADLLQVLTDAPDALTRMTGARP